jgi:hypothetical protein
MPDYHLSLYDTSGRRINRGNRISAADDLEAVAKTAEHRPSAVYRAILREGSRIVAEWPEPRLADAASINQNQL